MWKIKDLILKIHDDFDLNNAKDQTDEATK